MDKTELSPFTPEPSITTPETPEFSEDEKVSETALVVLWAKNISSPGKEIPYCDQIAKITGAEARTVRLLQTNFLDLSVEEKQETIGLLAATMQGRYLAVLDSVMRSDIDNVVELAPGVGPRGLQLTDRAAMQGRDFKYLGIDLPQITNHKNEVVRQILGAKGEARPNLMYRPANALDESQLETAVGSASLEGPIAICHEGLLPYFDKDQKQKVTQNIHQLLERHGGTYISADTMLRNPNISIEKVDKESPRSRILKIFLSYGIDLPSLTFPDLETAVSYYENSGFKVNVRNREHLLDQIGAVEAVGLDPERIRRMLANQYTFEMTLK